MLAHEVVRLISTHWLLVLLSAAVVYLLRNKYYNGLSKYPGPWLAAYTNWWRYFDVRACHAEKTHIELHRKHGDIVRLGPNVLSFADPRAIKAIYGLNKGMTKSDFCMCKSITIHCHKANLACQILFNKLWQRVNDFSHSSVPRTKTTMRSTAAVSTTPFRCQVWLAMNHWSIRR